MTPHAPVVLFVYNRPEHTHKTINALLANHGSEETEVFIFSDAAKKEAHQKGVDEVREIVKSVKGFKACHITCREENYGLAKSIIEGVTTVVDRYGRIIVLEDDIETSPAFLNYMNSALNFYQSHEKVMHVSSYIYPMEKNQLEDFFFLQQTTCWGWGTWKEKWKLFERNPAATVSKFSPQMIHEFNLNGAHNFWQQVKDNHSGKICTWAVFWQVAVFLNKGLSLHPKISFSRNIGMDGSGEHFAQTDLFEVEINSEPENFQFPENLELTQAAVDNLSQFFSKINNRKISLTRVFKFLRRKLGI